MKIELQYPYSNDWKWGYLTIRKTGRDAGRKNLSLYNKHKDRSSVSYARYLMSVELKRYLNDDEHVDHINGDKSDDRIENYQLLTPRQNSLKSCPPSSWVELICPTCEDVFVRRRKNTQLSMKNNKVTLCSMKCLGLYSNTSDINKKEWAEKNIIREFKLHKNDVKNVIEHVHGLKFKFKDNEKVTENKQKRL